MRYQSPIYNLIHQQIKACAERLLEVGQTQEICVKQGSSQILDRMSELHQFASKVRANEHYSALYALKHYLENTMLLYKDAENRAQTMRLSEVLSLLGSPSQTEQEFQPAIVGSLTDHFIRHFLEEMKPGRSLFKNLTDIKKI